MCRGGAGERLPGFLPCRSPWQHHRLPVQPVHHQDDHHCFQWLPADLRLHGQVSRWHQHAEMWQHQHRREGEEKGCRTSEKEACCVWLVLLGYWWSNICVADSLFLALIYTHVVRCINNGFVFRTFAWLDNSLLYFSSIFLGDGDEIVVSNVLHIVILPINLSQYLWTNNLPCLLLFFWGGRGEIMHFICMSC